MSERTRQIEELVATARVTLIKIGLKPAKIVYKKEKLEAGTANELERTRDWLIGFNAGFIGRYLKVRAMVPEMMWEHYVVNGVKNKWEVKELAATEKMVREEWAKRPDILKRSSSGKPTGKTRKAN